MTKIEKFLRRLVPKERELAEFLIQKIKKLDLTGLDVKKLTGVGDIYRLKKGDLRFKFMKVGKTGHIFDIQRRSDNTY